MRFTITPLGGSRQDLGAVVDAIVAYLRPRSAGIADTAARDGRDGVTLYYADDGEEPGRWLGAGAARNGLSGEVAAAELGAVLSGRDPRTGERLITAQGSAGRRPHLGAGQATKVGDGARIYDEVDAAAALGLTRAEVSRMLDVGTALAVGHLSAITQAGDRGEHRHRDPVRTISQVGGSYLVPVVDEHGTRWVVEHELDRCMSAREHDVDPDLVRALGDEDDLLTIGDAARIAGVTARYLRRLAAAYERDRDRIERRLAAGERPRSAYVVARRGTRDQWLVSRRELVAFLERRTPPAVRVGFDVTLTTEKSLGVLALLSGGRVSGEVLDAIQAGNDWAMGWLEERAAWGRERGESVQAEGWTAASYRHLTSRALDPFPHHHNVVANAVTLPDGSRRALDARRLYRHARAASALATAEMRRQLTLRLGVQWRPSRNGGWEVAGIDDGVLHEFSRRRDEIDEALRELEDELGRGAEPAEVDDIVLRTRPPKTHTNASQLTADWRRRAARLGLDAKRLRSLCGDQPPRINEPLPELMWRVLAGRGGVTDGGSVFTRADALVIAADVALGGGEKGSRQPLLLGAARIEALVDSFLSSPHVIRLDDSDDPLFTTVEMLGLQERIAGRFAAGLWRGPHRVPEPVIRGVLAQHDYLNDEQRALVRSWCRNGHRFQTAIGRAGTGKTTTVAACTQSWEQAGYRVRGAAVKGEAARTLAAATGIRCETLAWYLAHDDPDDCPLDNRTILVVDESSTVSDHDLDAVMSMALRSGASVRFIGDPAQHGAVAAGGMFRVLCERHESSTPELQTTHRVRSPEDRAAAEALRNGQIDEALDLLASAGHLHIVDDELTLHREVLARWWAAHLRGEEHPMVDRRNATRRQLNRLAHVMLRAHGAVGREEIVASGDRRFSVGDLVAARTPDRRLHVARNRRAYVRNGARGTVTAISAHRRRPQRDKITVHFDGIGPIVIPRSFFDEHVTMSGKHEVGIDHAYALTSYAVQGATHEVSTSRIDSTASRSETYVDITRGRSANHLYLTRARSPLEGEALPRPPDPPVDEEVQHRLERSTAEITAYELVHAVPGQRGKRGRDIEVPRM